MTVTFRFVSGTCWQISSGLFATDAYVNIPTLNNVGWFAIELST